MKDQFFSRSLIFLCVSVTACTTPETVREHRFRTTVEDGIRVYTTSQAPKYSGPLFEYEAVLELKQDPAIEESLLYRASRFTMDRDGFFYVVDGGNHRIAVFDEEGTYQRSFGGEGEGPGTFRRMDLQDFHDGILHILDRQLNRTTLMRTDGSLEDVLIRPRIRDTARRYVLADDRQLLLTAIQNNAGGFNWFWVGGTIMDSGIDTVATFRTTPVKIGIYGDVAGSTPGRVHTGIRFSGMPCSDYSPGQGILLTDGQQPVIFRYDAGGDLVGRIEFDIPPEPVTAEEREWYIADADRRVRESEGRRRDVARTSRELMTIPDFKGFWEGMYIDDAGYIWLTVVEDFNRRREEGGGALCDIISPDGEYLGRSRLPGLLRLGTVVNGHYLTMIRAEETGDTIPTVFSMTPVPARFGYP